MKSKDKEIFIVESIFVSLTFRPLASVDNVVTHLPIDLQIPNSIPVSAAEFFWEEYF